MKNSISVQQGYAVMFREYPDVVDVEQMRHMLGGIGRRTAYRLLKDSAIECVKIGRTYRIAKISIIAYLCKLPAIDEDDVS